MCRRVQGKCRRCKIMHISVIFEVFMLSAILIHHVDGARRHLTEIETVQAVEQLEEGHTQREVARRFGVSCSVISRLWTRFQTTHWYTRRPGQGRSRCTTARLDRYLRTLALRNRQSTARALEHDFHRATGVHTSD